jgi:hypothetical protein
LANGCFQKLQHSFKFNIIAINMQHCAILMQVK